ncbi:hypothetical protein TTHERM_00467530 (macronuclear) [Tetrahymena thermophila SB210]|uniref:Uncharacterized protein n=1 Tax=Tetrahymena thermophila (strain SB210) TaxID=312017 RepID=I7LXK2_TETTS|nr:hypothetical protein TTHERM_00467530 [Tetrahymena thermophila SB210]EAS04804.2 hypothetical protein TTHERM_00467530 [Tetrahymena thermophila SB210]|eukprot:XP_001025049.2 hypothetical protein TTHERM_00467530 [Tetrahymena thermophila SB210]
MINNQNQFQIEPTVHHPNGEYQNYKRLDPHLKSDTSSPFQASTPRIQYSNRDDSPVIKFFNSKQVIPNSNLQIASQQQYPSYNQQHEDFNGSYNQVYYQQTPVQQNINQVNKNPLGKIQLLKVSDQYAQQQVHNNLSQSNPQQKEQLSMNEVEKINNVIKGDELSPLNMNALQERPDKNQKRERNHSLPLQLAQYMKPSILLEKITNTFKNKSPQSALQNKEQDIQNNYFNHTMPQAGVQKIPFDEQSQLSARQNKINPQIFSPKVRILQREMPLQEQVNNYQQTEPRQTRYSASYLQNNVMNSASPNSKVYIRTDISPQQQQVQSSRQYIQQPQYILRSTLPLNASADYSLSNQTNMQNQSGFITDRNNSISSQDLSRQMVYTPHHKPIFQQPFPIQRIQQQRQSVQYAPQYRQSISHIGEVHGNEFSAVNRSLNQLPNQNNINSQGRNIKIIQNGIPNQINQPYNFLQSSQPQQIQIYQNQQNHHGFPQKMFSQHSSFRQYDAPENSQLIENQKKIEQNLNKAINQRYQQNQQDQAGHISNQTNLSNEKQVPISKNNNINQASPNAWNNNQAQHQSIRNQNLRASGQFSFLDNHNSKDSDRSYQKEVQSIDSKENELNQAISAIQKLTNEKYQLINQVEQLTNELSEQAQLQLKYQQQINQLQSEIDQSKTQIQEQIHNLKMELENEKLLRQNEAVIYNQKINNEQQIIINLQQKNEELQKTLAQRSTNIQKSIYELEQIGKILNDNEAWQKIYQFQKESEAGSSKDQSTFLDKIKESNLIEEEMNKLLDERTILMQEITNQNDFLKGKLLEFKKQGYSSGSQNQKEMSQVQILEQQLQISEIQKKELAQEQDLMANLYECQIAQLKAQLQNKNEIIQVKYQENKFFLNQIQDLENSIKKSPYRKEDKAPIGHVAPFCQVPEKQLKKLNQKPESNFQQVQNKKEEDNLLIKKNNEEEHLDESEETSNVKQSNMIDRVNAQKQDSSNQLTEQQIRLNSVEEDLVKQKLFADQNSQSAIKKAENQPVIPVFMTYQEYNQKMSRDNKSKIQENQKTDSKSQNSNLQQSHDKYNQNDIYVEKQNFNKTSKNQYSPVKREDQIQANFPPLQENKNINSNQDQEEDILLNKQQNSSQQNLNMDIQYIQNEDNFQIDKDNCQISKSILDKYNDYLQGEKLYMEEDSLNYQQRNHVLSTIKEELPSEHQTNFSSVYQNQNNQNNELKQNQNQNKKNTIKNYSNYIENLKINLKQSQEQRKLLEEQVNNIIKTSNIAFKEDDEENSYIDEPLNKQMDTFDQDTNQNQGVAVQIKLSGNQIKQNMEQNQLNDQQNYNYEWDSNQIPQLEEVQDYEQNQIESNYNEEQNNCNYNLRQDDKQQIKNSKYKYEDEIPVNHSTFQNQNEYERQYQEIINQQNVIKQQFKFLK